MLRTEAMDRPKTRPRALAIFGLLLGALVTFGCASAPAPRDWTSPLYGEEEIEALFAGTDFRPIRRIQDIPEPVQATLRGQGSLPFMANPREPFNWSDVIFPDLAMRRLIFGGRSGNKVFLYYEHGGFAYYLACTAYEIGAATVREVPIEGCFRKSRQDTLMYLKYLMQDWPEATRDPVALNPKVHESF